jgi:cyclase
LRGCDAMAFVRVIPVLLLKNAGLVKTVKFGSPRYVGDPINAVRIFNDKGVDELMFLDITATREKRGPDFRLISDIASECFMPLAYGGGVRTLEDAKRVLTLGSEKVVINSYAAENPAFITEAAKVFGSQSVVVSFDVKKNILGRYTVWTQSGTKNTGMDPMAYAKNMEEKGAGELMLNSIDRDGTGRGYDLDLIRRVTSAVSVPVVACGGAASVEDFGKAVSQAGASAVAAGSFFVFHGPHRAVIITYPEPEALQKAFETTTGGEKSE